MKNILQFFRLKNAFTSMAFLFALCFGMTLNAQSFSENFDDITTLSGNGWMMTNNSDAPNSDWFQGNPVVFDAQAGAPEAYIGVNFNSTSNSVISNWLITPERTFNAGDKITFYARTVTGNTFPDRMEVRLSTSGASTDVGATPTSVGDFTTVLVEINPTLMAGGFPDDWMQFTINLSSAQIPNINTKGRLAFRYWVTDAGPFGANSNYIGLDEFTYTATAVGDPIPALSVWGTWIFGLMIFTLGLVFMYNLNTKQQLAMGGNVAFTTGNYDIPFDKALYMNKLRSYAFPIVVIGFALVRLIWGELIVDDFIGMALITPLIIYIIHLFSMFRK